MALYIVATPIGNLSDITFRALETLKSVDFVLAEDTRETKKLLDHYQIDKPMISYHQHSKLSKIDAIIDLLKQGKNLALVSDAGTPGISDPGGKLVAEVIRCSLSQPVWSDAGRLPAQAGQTSNDTGGHADNRSTTEIKIVPIPGACALTAAASISGFPTDKFIFFGFPPHKNKRQKFFNAIADATETVIIYESKHRILKTLEDLKSAFIRVLPAQAGQICADSREVVVCRELTKKFEVIHRGIIDKLTSQLKNDIIKGEFVIVISRRH